MLNTDEIGVYDFCSWVNSSWSNLYGGDNTLLLMPLNLSRIHMKLSVLVTS